MKAIVVRGKRVRALISLLKIPSNPEYDAIYITEDFKCCLACNYKRNVINRNVRCKVVTLNRIEFKKITTVYNITGDVEASLMFLFKE